jgi:hypothetical protein
MLNAPSGKSPLSVNSSTQVNRLNAQSSPGVIGPPKS